jgi:ketosteroid isomerase-like protein
MKKALLAALCAASLSTWAQPLPTVTLPPDVARVLQDYARAWQANDPAALAGLFTPDGMALPSGKPPAQGADSIRQAYSQGAGTPLLLRPIAFGTSGELAYVIGNWGPSADKADYGKFTLVLRRSADGRWLIVSDMDNANASRRAAPPAPAASAGG